MTFAAQWTDLRVRILSGLAVLAVGLSAVWCGGIPVRLLASGAAGLMIWELARMQAPDRPAEARLSGALATVALAAVLWRHDVCWMVVLLLPAAGLLLMPGRDRLLHAIYAALLMLACYAFVAFREGFGLAFALWLLLIVVASDVLGYFGGRIIGGPKFWPRLSPKKTWSGTVSGWAGAAVVGLAFAALYREPVNLVVLSVLTAFAAQMGDIAESWIKRRAGVKDSSALIPGHGGVLDRFDALIGASVFILLWVMARMQLPDFGY